MIRKYKSSSFNDRSTRSICPRNTNSNPLSKGRTRGWRVWCSPKPNSKPIGENLLRRACSLRTYVAREITSCSFTSDGCPQRTRHTSLVKSLLVGSFGYIDSDSNCAKFDVVKSETNAQPLDERSLSHLFLSVVNSLHDLFAPTR